MAYHELVKDGDLYLNTETNETVRAVCPEVPGELVVVLPDHYDENGQPVGQGGTIRLRRGDWVLGREDGFLVGMKGAAFAQKCKKA